MNAEILSIGTELLLGHVVDTNSAYIGRKLADIGINLYHKTTVGDNKLRAIASLREALRRVDIVIITGGLGPTEDDITREVVAEALGIRQIYSHEAAEYSRSVLKRRGYPNTERFPERAFLSFVIPHPALALVLIIS